ncbi:MAG: Nucleoside-diphosphate-sugar pyrophosphorylase, partial [Pedosphaera sp.]|nr:Nucleoside-diphosphate-sugar pyrophosphorylase [Pedosphaera sp.]
MFKPGDLFDLSQTEHAALFEGCEYAWDALKKLKAYIEAHAKTTPHSHERARVYIGDRV